MLMCEQLDQEMDEGCHVLKQQPQSPSVREVMEISQREVAKTDASDERQDTAGAPLDLSRHSPTQPHTPPSGLTAATVPGVGPVSPCHGARPPSDAGLDVAEERRPVMETVSEAAGSALPAVSPTFQDTSNITPNPIATQVNKLLSNRLTSSHSFTALR